MGNRVSLSGALSESAQTLASSNKQEEEQEWHAHAYPNLAFVPVKRRNCCERAGSECSFDSSPSHSEAEAPVIPPRRWSTATVALKQQLQQQQRMQQSEQQQHQQQDQEEQQKRPRIQPIVRAGRQVTKDFYWVLPERSKSVRSTQYHNLPLRRTCRSESDRSPAKEPAVSAAVAQCLVADVRKRVLGVTDEECYVALSLHSWDSDRAVRYLMVEQLFRLGLADRRFCIDELKSNDWNLQAACNSLLQHHQNSS